MEFPATRLSRGEILVLFLACVLTFANGIGGDFTYDDKAIVRDNLRIRAPAKVSEIFTTSYFGGARGTGSVYRPVLLLSYAVQWWIHGKRAEAFHVVNVSLHAAATVLLAWLLLRVGIARSAALAGALLFSVAPIHVEAVTSLVGRGELLSAVFSLVYLHLALSSFVSRGVRRLAPLLLALVCYPLAVLTKESGSSVPALAFLLFFFAADGGAREKLRRAFSGGFPVLAGSAAGLAGVLLLRQSVLGGPLTSPGTTFFEVENVLDSLNPVERAVNACMILLRYVGRTVFPLHLSADESAWSIDVLPALSLPAIAAVLLIAGLLVVSLRRLPSRLPLALGLLFFVIAFLPASNLLFPIGTAFAERLAYFPSAGLCLAAGALLAGTADRWREMAPARRGLLVAVVLLFSARSIVRNAVWWSDEGLFLNLVRTSPDSAKAHYDLAYVWAGEKQYARARNQYEEATDLYEDYWDAWAGKGRMEKELGLLEEAERSYRKAIEANEAYENGYFGLGLVREARGDLAGAEEIYRRGLAQKPGSLPLGYRLALARSRLDWPEALPDWRRAVALGADVPSVHEGFAAWLLRVGKTEAALREAREALRRDPRSLAALRLAGDANAKLRRPFAEALAREKAFRASRSREDWDRLLVSAEGNEAYASRLKGLRKSLEKLLPSRRSAD